MANLHSLAKLTADRRDQLGTLLASTQRVANTLRNQQTHLGNLVDQGQDFIGELVARQNTFHAMLAALTNLTGNLNNVVVTDRSMLDEMLINVRALSDMLGQHDDLLRSLIQSAPPPLRVSPTPPATAPVSSSSPATGSRSTRGCAPSAAAPSSSA